MSRAGMLMVVLLGGCRAIFGLDEPQLIDARGDSAPSDQALADGRRIDASTDANPNTCPSDYTLTFGTSRYKLVITPTGLTWVSAASACASHVTTGNRHTHLAVIGDSNEWLYMRNLSGGVYWVGLNDRLTQGTFLWVTDENTAGYPPATGDPWEAGQPAGTGHDCVATVDLGHFQDALCDSAIAYLCECDSHSNDPTNYTP